jgi:hypothetical protein
MSDPKRLLEMGADDFEREVLKSALPDRGSHRAYERTLATIAAGTAFTVATAATSAATPVGASVVLKWLGVGALVGFATAGSVSVALEQKPVPSKPVLVEAPAAKLAEAPARPAVPEERAATPIPEPPEKLATRTTSISTSEPIAAAGPSIGTLPAAASSEKLLREVRTLDRAKSALSSGNAAVALQALDEHDRGFPDGALGPEATVLRARALVAAGNRPGALAIARGIVRSHPESAHAKTLRTLLPELGTNP